MLAEIIIDGNTQVTITCTYCEGEIDPDTAERDPNNNLICEDCFDNSCGYCDDCGNLVCLDDLRETGDHDMVCPCCVDDHYEECDHCGDLIRDTRVYSARHAGTGDEVILCSYCDTHYAYTCHCCEESIYSPSGSDPRVYSDIYDDYVCEDCYDDLDDSAIISDYHHTNASHFYKQPNETSPMYMGVELEIDDGYDRYTCASEILSSLGSELVECKHDGSLDCGFEIVTQPATLQYFYEHRVFEAIANIANAYDFKSHDAGTCGLHIHVDRKAFNGDEHLATVIALVEKFYDTHIFPFSRRKNRQWCEKPEPYAEDIEEYKSGKTDATKTYIRKNWKRGAVNTGNNETIEFRFNRGTLNTTTIYASLQLIYNLIERSRNLKFDAIDLVQWEEIIYWNVFDELTMYNDKRQCKYSA